MKFYIQLSDSFGTEIEINDFCPLCNKPTNPELEHTNYNLIQGELYKAYLVLRCLGCKQYWLEEFIYDTDSFTPERWHVEKQLPSDLPFTDKVKELSPNGVKTYIQSIKAEQEGLDMIAGIGYRKSLEFFIKDFAIKENPDSEKEIKDKWLSAVITEYIDNPKLTAYATATAILGNDETHYLRIHTDKDIEHLKTYLSGVLHYIDLQLTFPDVLDLNNRKKS